MAQDETVRSDPSEEELDDDPRVSEAETPRTPSEPAGPERKPAPPQASFGPEESEEHPDNGKPGASSNGVSPTTALPSAVLTAQPPPPPVAVNGQSGPHAPAPEQPPAPPRPPSSPPPGLAPPANGHAPGANGHAPGANGHAPGAVLPPAPAPEPMPLGEQATTLMPKLPPMPRPPVAMPPRRPDDTATKQANRKLAWVLAGAVILVGILLLAVFGGSDDAPDISTPVTSTFDSNTLAPPTTTPSLTPSTTVAPPSTTATTPSSPTTLPPITTTAPKVVVPPVTTPKPVVRTTAPRRTTRTTAPPEPTRTHERTTERDPWGDTDPDSSDPDPYSDSYSGSQRDRDSTRRNSGSSSDPYGDGVY